MNYHNLQLIFPKSLFALSLIIFFPFLSKSQTLERSIIASFGLNSVQADCSVGEIMTFTGQSDNSFLTQGFHQPTSIVALCQTPHEESINLSACNSIELNGETYNQSGSFTQMLIADDGCDSLLHVNVTLNTLSNETTTIDNTLFAIQENANYAWTLCGEEDVLGTSQIFVPSESGDYQVTITQENCEVISECVSFVVGVEEIASRIEINVYPNPTHDVLNVKVLGTFGDCSFTVYDTFGRAVMSSQMTNPSIQLNAEELALGSYLIVLYAKNSIFTQSFVKV